MLSIKVVSNNVKVSNKVVKPDNWHYISSSDNPADIAKGFFKIDHLCLTSRLSDIDS